MRAKKRPRHSPDIEQKEELLVNRKLHQTNQQTLTQYFPLSVNATPTTSSSCATLTTSLLPARTTQAAHPAACVSTKLTDCHRDENARDQQCSLNTAQVENKSTVSCDSHIPPEDPVQAKQSASRETHNTFCQDFATAASTAECSAGNAVAGADRGDASDSKLVGACLCRQCA
eukprot:SAG31_NODE_3207_length_4553_cov_1.406376_2_plen_173_part_00